LRDYWTPTVAFYAMYEWNEISEVVRELLVMVQKTCNASEDAKLMAVRKKYSVKKLGLISVKAQERVSAFAEMQKEVS